MGRAVMALLAIVGAAAACTHAKPNYQQELRRISTGLSLTLETAGKTVITGAPLVVVVCVCNTSAQQIHACVARGTSLRIIPRDGTDRPLLWYGATLPPTCEQEVSLAPASCLRRPETVQIPTFLSGHVQLAGWLQVSCAPPSYHECGDATIQGVVPLTLVPATNQ